MATTIANLQAVLSVDPSGLTSGLKDAQEKTKSFGSTLSDIGKQAAGFALAQIGVSSLTDVLGMAKDTLGGWIQGAEEAQVAQAHLNQILDSGQHITGLTAQAVSDLRDKLAAQDNVDDDAVQSVENVFAAYSGLSKEAFPQATQSAIEMARAYQMAHGGSLDAAGAAEALQGAMMKPTRAMATLKQYGVDLTQQDQDQIKVWSKKGDAADIQALIMQRVGEATKKATDAYDSTAQGKIEAFHTKMDNLGKSLASNFLPAIADVASKGVDFLNWISGSDGPLKSFGSILGGIAGNGGPADLLKKAMAQAQPILQQVGDIFQKVLLPAFKDMEPVVKALVNEELAHFQMILENVQPVLKALSTVLQNVILPIFKTLTDVFASDILPAMSKVWDAIGAQLLPALLKLWNAIEPLVELLAKLLGPVLQLIGWILSNIVGPALLLVINIIAGAITVIATVIGWFTNFGSTLQSVANFVGFLVGKLGDLLGILGKVKDAAGSALGGVLSHIPGFAEGTDDAPGGLAWVGEHGPELMMVPQHATIYPSGTGPASNSSTSSGESGRGVHIGALHVYGDDADQTARAVAAQLNWQQMLLG